MADKIYLLTHEEVGGEEEDRGFVRVLAVHPDILRLHAGPVLPRAGPGQQRQPLRRVAHFLGPIGFDRERRDFTSRPELLRLVKQGTQIKRRLKRRLSVIHHSAERTEPLHRSLATEAENDGRNRRLTIRKRLVDDSERRFGTGDLSPERP